MNRRNFLKSISIAVFGVPFIPKYHTGGIVSAHFTSYPLSGDCVLNEMPNTIINISSIDSKFVTKAFEANKHKIKKNYDGSNGETVMEQYRGKQVNGKGWVYGFGARELPNLKVAYIVDGMKSKTHFGHKNTIEYVSMTKVYPKSIGRNTGESKWEEGKKVFDYYENDIVEVMLYNISRRCFEMNYIGIIVWNFASFRVRSLDGTREEITGYDSHIIRLIGNTTDNPELLKK